MKREMNVNYLRDELLRLQIRSSILKYDLIKM